LEWLRMIDGLVCCERDFHCPDLLPLHLEELCIVCMLIIPTQVINIQIQA